MFESIIGTEITLTAFLICTAVSLVLGLGVALLARVGSRATKGYAVTLAILPAVVELVIMLVNGNIGAGLGVAGAFGLVRFRSAPGTARDILLLFFSVAIGLATGMGYVLLAAIFFLIVGAALLALTALHFGAGDENDRVLRVQIPESLDYDGLFDDLFAKYTLSSALDKVKTANLGTVYELEYAIRLRTPQVPKEFLDEVRVRNGNLNVTCSKVSEKNQL